MRSNRALTSDRRAFLRFLAGSPYVAALGGLRTFAQTAPEIASVIGDPREALNVMDFEEAAHRKVLPGHWAYIKSGVDDDLTLRGNRDAYRRIQLRPSRLHDATKVEMRVELLGTVYNSPIFTCPTGGECSLHPDGELAVARATKERGTLQILSASTSTAVEDVNAAHGRPVWYQLYAVSKWDVVEQIVHRVEAAACPVIALTVDSNTGRNTETFSRTRPKDRTTCTQCHGPNGPLLSERKMYKGIDLGEIAGQDPSITWEFVDRLRKLVTVKLFIKGIETKQDAHLAIEHGVDGIVVSNHGGRSTETLRPTIQALPEVVTEVAGRIPVFVDGGVRRGTDVFKALALGAKGVGIGRPFLWGLGAFGQAGVDRVLEILQGELKLVMGNCGAQNVAAINHSYVETPEHWI
jgi:isopentenyl diphosphate isomerase/L-lactate dehydrogenase-like FMN-dependent dehydrogenase